MRPISGRVLFFVTSPRSPLKMIPEIKLLTENFTGQKWSPNTQERFMNVLFQEPFFKNVEKPKDPALSARDRINRAPKALGFVELYPMVRLTEPGRQLLDEDLSQEALLRQILKFQIPSPFHVENKKIAGTYFVKPYLEMIRLIDSLETISFDELMLFGMQLTDYRKFDTIIAKINKFRAERKICGQNYRTFFGNYVENEILAIYKKEIDRGDVKTRESNDRSLKRFIETKRKNLRDYADACFRYLRATGLVTISQRRHTISIMKDKQVEVSYYLKHIGRSPVFIDDEKSYKTYLYDATQPVLFSDNRELLESYAKEHKIDITLDTPKLKKAIKLETEKKRNQIIKESVGRLKSHASDDYADVINVFADIKAKNLYDIPLMLEWNTWRAMTMLDGGEINANLKFDDEGQPLSTAAGNMADIICEYDDFNLTVEVTTSSGAKQFEMEGEPIARHLAKLKKEKGKTAYCFFIAPTISEASIAYCYTMYRINLAFYAGTTEIIPLNLDTFIEMVNQTEECGYTPQSDKIKKLCEYAKEKANTSINETDWFNDVQQKARKWLANDSIHTNEYTFQSQELALVAENKASYNSENDME